MQNNNILGLYEHNIIAYEKLKNAINSNQKIVSLIHATGTGKTYIFEAYAYDNKDKKILFISPYNSINEHIKNNIKQNPNIDLERDFSHVNFITYQSLINMSREELAALDYDVICFDEFHHLGAPVWGARANTLVNTHKDAIIIGMTAYNVRDRGTLFERDMTNPDTDEIFSNSIVSTYDLCDAMIDGVLPKPIYKSAYLRLKDYAEKLEELINNGKASKEQKEQLQKLIYEVKKRLSEAKNIDDILKINIKRNGKYIYFCPVGLEKEKKGDNSRTIDKIKEDFIKCFPELNSDDIVIYTSTSDIGKLGEENREAFYNDNDLDGKDASAKLRVMFCINQYNEGVHAPGIDGVILDRETKSDIVYFEQIGRALSVRGRTKEEYEEYSKLNGENLIKLCDEREISIQHNLSKEEIIQRLLAPTIIDLAGNIEFIKELETNLQNRVREIQKRNNTGNHRKIAFTDTSFDLDILNEDLFEILRYVKDRLTLTWNDKYDLAKAYYEHHGNLEIPREFKTINGYEYAEEGINLGKWISTQRLSYQGKGTCKITEEQIQLLEEIGMRFENIDTMGKWLKKYELAKVYYEHHGNLEIPRKFKTKNGYEYVENGIALGRWIDNQRQTYQGKGMGKITEEQIKLLEKIGMRFENIDTMEEWMNKYNLAKAYFEHYGNLEIPRKFKTKNGYEYAENGVALGRWINYQRQTYQGKGMGKITEEQIKLLEKIGMRFENIDTMEEWMNKYNLTKAYFEHYGNLEIPTKFKTKNGYEYAENGIKLGIWIYNQRNAYKGKGMGKITEEQIKLLEKIGMKWFSNSIDKRLQEESINETNIQTKQKELENRFYSLLNSYEKDGVYFDELNKENINKINDDFRNSLDNRKK